MIHFQNRRLFSPLLLLISVDNENNIVDNPKVHYVLTILIDRYFDDRPGADNAITFATERSQINLRGSLFLII